MFDCIVVEKSPKELPLYKHLKIMIPLQILKYLILPSLFISTYYYYLYSLYFNI